MSSAETYIGELETRNETSFKMLLTNYLAAVTHESLCPADLLRVELKSIIEDTEVTAIWVTDVESLDLKMALAAQCGSAARHFRLVSGRLQALGIEPGAFDPRFGGYSKLFAFLRSLHSTEERAAASSLTQRAFNLQRFAALATICEGQGDLETAHLFREVLAQDDREQMQTGRQTLIAVAIQEENQARARRAAYRTVELLGELFEPTVVRRFLSRSMAKKTVAAV